MVKKTWKIIQRYPDDTNSLSQLIGANHAIIEYGNKKITTIKLRHKGKWFNIGAHIKQLNKESLSEKERDYLLRLAITMAKADRWDLAMQYALTLKMNREELERQMFLKDI